MKTIGTLPEWTPCEEGLPETEGRYFVTYMLGEMPWVSILNYGVPYTADEKDNVWYYADDEYGDVIYDDVLAWMPLQEPYKPKVNKDKVGDWVYLGHVPGVGKHPWSVDYECPFCGYIAYWIPPGECPECGATLHDKHYDEIMSILRPATAEESESVNEYVESVSVKTGANVLDGDNNG